MEIQIQGGAMRYIYGIVARLGMQGQNHRRHACKARLSPWLWLWLATRRSDVRIFQNQTVPDIIEQVLGVYGHPLRKKRTRGNRSGYCCVQYNESDCDLVPRWMQHQGIYFFFEHASHSALPGMNPFLSILLKRPPQAIRKTSTPGSWSRKSSRAAIAATALKLHGQAWPGRYQ